jgi:hypothetical protein
MKQKPIGVEGKLFIVGVVLLIVFLWFSWWINIALPWNLFSSILGLFHVYFINFCFVMVLSSYFRSCFLNPGTVPANWIPEGATVEELEKAKNTSYNPHNVSKVVWCHTCQNFKPRRATHCRDCDCCILKMDHHCPWIGNCVGHRNYKSFILFLFYAVTGMTDAYICFFIRFIELFTQDVETVLLQKVTFLLSWLFVGVFFCSDLYFRLSN